MDLKTARLRSCVFAHWVPTGSNHESYSFDGCCPAPYVSTGAKGALISSNPSTFQSIGIIILLKC